jgi:hypothetical protein
MDIQVYEATDVVARRGKGGKKGGAKYADYAAAVKQHLPWLDEEIEKSVDKTIRVKLADFSKACGKIMKQIVNGEVKPGAQGLDPTSLVWAYKYVLYHAGFFFTTGKVEDGQPVMIIRKIREGDVLPASLAKYDAAVAAGTEIGTQTGTDEESETV